MQHPSDLCENCKSSSIQKESKFLARSRRKLMSFFNKRTEQKSDSDDLSQEVFCKILKRYGVLDDRYPDEYLYRVAWDVFYDQARRDFARYRNQHCSIVDSTEESIPSKSVFSDELLEDISPEQITDGNEQYDRFLSALNQLTQKQRDVFLLNRYEGLTYTQIAHHYGISVSAVEKCMMKALVCLKEKFGNHSKF